MTQDRSQPDSATIDTLIADLTNKDGIARQKARAALVQIGPPALAALAEVFATKRSGYAHWEAAKAISAIGGPDAAALLAQALLAETEFSVRWIAAEGLVAIGSSALAHIAKALTQEESAHVFYDGAHHVIHDLISLGLIDKATIAQVKPLQQALSMGADGMRIRAESARLLAWLNKKS